MVVRCCYGLFGWFGLIVRVWIVCVVVGFVDYACGCCSVGFCCLLLDVWFGVGLTLWVGWLLVFGGCSGLGVWGLGFCVFVIVVITRLFGLVCYLGWLFWLVDFSL